LVTRTAIQSRSKPARSASGATPATSGASASPPAQQSKAIESLREDHRRVEKLFGEFETADNGEKKQQLVRQICSELILHTALEEEIFYPACRKALEEAGKEMMNEAQVEHDSTKFLIADLQQAEPDDPYLDSKVSVLSEQIKHHVAEEEKPGDGILAQALSHQVETPELASRLQQRKQELQGRAAEARPSRVVSFDLESINQTEGSMARTSSAGRDERGRFTSDDDDRRGRSASSRGGRSRYDDDEDDNDRGGRGRGRGGWFGDSEGHSRAAHERFEDDDDDRRGSSRRSRSRDDDDDDRGGRGRGGWFGDSEGHSRAARERFDDNEDDRGGGSRRSRGGRDDDDDDDRGGRGRGRGGWFGDSEGHARAARQRFEDDDDDRRGSPRRSRSRDDDDDDDRGGRSRGRGGWFGDSEGHARAALERWEDDSRGGSRRSRGRDDDDDDRGRSRRSRSRDDDDDDQGRGWFGDPRGHAEAARRGWQHRR
jgi:hemerythrin superfamily protein